MKLIKKIIAFAIIAISILQIFLPMIKSNAMEVGDNTYVQRADKGFYSVQKWTGTQWLYITYSVTRYTDENGISRIAYCVDPDLKGVGYVSGEYEGYNVELTDLISDERLWRVFTNGYPYKTPEQLGVETEDDAYLATKHAAYCILRGNTIDDIRANYRAGTVTINDESLEDIQRRGNKVIDAICNLVNIGYNGTETMKYNDILSVEKVGELTKDESNKDYYYQEYRASSAVEFDDYSVDSISGFTTSSYIADMEGNAKNSFLASEYFKVMIPKNEIKSDISGSVSISAKCKNYPIYYGKCTIGNYQNYMICCDTYSNNITASVNTNVNAEKSKLKIVKTDKDSGIPIAGVKYNVRYDTENGNNGLNSTEDTNVTDGLNESDNTNAVTDTEDNGNIGDFVTDENGVINIDGLKPGKVLITEIETDEKYVLDSETKEVELGYEEEKTIYLENERKKGAIRIIKVDSDNTEYRLSGVTFEVHDESGNLIATVTTDDNGEALIEDLPMDTNYTVKEVSTQAEYVLSNDEVTVTLDENQIKNLTFMNKKKEAVLTKLPRTGENDFRYILYGIGVCLILFIGLIIKKSVCY